MQTAEFAASSDYKNNGTCTGTGCNILPFASKFHQSKMQSVLIKVGKGEVENHSLSHEGEEFIYVLSGVLNFRVGNTTYKLEEGDSLYFNATESHGMLPSPEEVIYLDVFL